MVHLFQTNIFNKMERISYQELPQAFFEHLGQIEDYIKQSNLDLKLIDLVRLRISQINECAYCLDMHYKEARHAGETELRLSMLSAWRETDFFTDQEKTVFEYAEALTLLPNHNIAKTFEVLSSYYSKEEIAYISLAITQMNTWNRLMKAFNFKAGYFKVN